MGKGAGGPALSLLLLLAFLLPLLLPALLPEVHAQSYYLRVYFGSAVINGVTLSASNPAITVQPGAVLEGYFEARVENVQPGSWITPVIGTASWTRRQFSCIASSAPTGTSNQRYTFRITAPNTPGTYYIGIFAGWMYTCDEVASNDHPANYDDGDDVWDMSSQRWEEVISNGQASTGPYQMPGRAIRIVVQQNYYLRVRLDSATLNGQGLSTSNPELRVNPGSRITGTVTFTVENVQPGSWITPVIWVTSWERGTVSNGRVRVVADDIRSTRQFTVNIDVTAPSSPGTYYIGFFTGWMYSADEVASNDHPPNYGDGDDVWDMPGQGWEEVISNGQASTGPYRMPGRAIRIVVQQQQQLNVDVWTNKGGQGIGNLGGGQYSIGESVTLFCSVNINVDSLRVRVIRPDGAELTALERGSSPAGTYQASGTAGEPAGERRVICEARLGGQSSSDEVRFTVLPPSDTTPPTVRVIAPNGGERLSPGSVFRIRWEASDNVGVTGLYIRLYQDGVMRMFIADNPPNTGYYDWTVPNRPGSNYKIVVIARDAAGNFGEDESDGTFEIVGGPITATLQVGITHTCIGDLRIWVGVEGGREVLIKNFMEGGCTRNLFREWDLLQLGFTTNDLPPSESRRWYLRISDEALFDEGRLEYFRIIYQGQTYESQDHPEIKDKQVVWAWIPSRGVPSLPDLTVRDVSFSPQTVSQGGSITVSWTEINVGSGNAGPYRVGIYLGVSEYGRDLLLGSFNRDGLTAGGSRSYMQTFTIPSDVPAGSYYVTVFIDDLRAVSEANEENNIGSSTPNRLTITSVTQWETLRTVNVHGTDNTEVVFQVRKLGDNRVDHEQWFKFSIEIRDVNGQAPRDESPFIRGGKLYLCYDRRTGPNVGLPTRWVPIPPNTEFSWYYTQYRQWGRVLMDEYTNAMNERGFREVAQNIAVNAILGAVSMGADSLLRIMAEAVRAPTEAARQAAQRVYEFLGWIKSFGENLLAIFGIGLMEEYRDPSYPDSFQSIVLSKNDYVCQEALIVTKPRYLVGIDWEGVTGWSADYVLTFPQPGNQQLIVWFYVQYDRILGLDAYIKPPREERIVINITP
jgi:hypothetical protein